MPLNVAVDLAFDSLQASKNLLVELVPLGVCGIVLRAVALIKALHHEHHWPADHGGENGAKSRPSCC